MIVLVLGAVALAFFVWLGRGGGRRDPRPVLWTLASVAAAGAAVFVGLRGLWIVSLALVVVSMALARETRLPRFRRTGRTYFRPPPPAAPAQGMSLAEARDILGVAPGASRAEIEAAFRRLMQRAHPDHGGSAGLAAKINAARERLLG
jgi:hypothetical protein